MDRLEKIKEVTIKKPYTYSFIAVSLGFLTLNIILNQLWVVFPVVNGFAKWFIIPFLIFTFAIPVLMAININLAYKKYKLVKEIKKVTEIQRISGTLGNRGFPRESGLSFIGAFGSLFAGCPNCFAGFFPAIIGLFGITATTAILPLKGLEFQAAGAILLSISIFFLTRDINCKIK